MAIHLVTSHFRIQINLDEIDYYACYTMLDRLLCLSADFIFYHPFSVISFLYGKEEPSKICPTLPKYDFVAQLVVVRC